MNNLLTMKKSSKKPTNLQNKTKKFLKPKKSKKKKKSKKY